MRIFGADFNQGDCSNSQVFLEMYLELTSKLLCKYTSLYWENNIRKKKSEAERLAKNTNSNPNQRYRIQ